MDTVRLDHLAIGYNGKHGQRRVVLSDICATVNSGELTCLIGANGVGKSTLLRTLAAFQPRLAGDISIKGKSISEFSTKQLATVIGVVLTEKPYVANMTATDMVLMGRAPYTGFWGSYSAEDYEAVRQAIGMVGVGHLAGRLVSTLSDGERQKVMIAKALAQQTPIVYLDEPTAFLDYPSKVEIMRLLHKICRETDKTVFLSTHDLELALQLADTIWLMDATKGISTGTPEDMALDGRLAGFFANRGVAFEPSTGLFKAVNDISRSVGIVGLEGPRRAMLEKALLRNGIKADASATDVSIEIKESAFSVAQQGGPTVSVDNIAGVIRLLSSPHKN